MKEELKGPEVEKVAVAIACEEQEGSRVYNVYLINERNDELEEVIVNSKGYFIHKETQEHIKTNVLRKRLGNIAPQSAQMIEPIMEDVLSLNNEYWVSFWIGKTMYDKKFVFLAESVIQENFVTLPLLGTKGVFIGT